MKYILPILKNTLQNINVTKPIVFLILILLLLINFAKPVQQNIISPLSSKLTRLTPLEEGKKGYEVFGFAPYWTFDKLENVDFETLTTFAYFGIPVEADGNLNTSDSGYHTFESDEATRIFKKAHAHGTRVVLTITQMDNSTIRAFLDDDAAQQRAIEQSVDLVKQRGIDGINVDFEYSGDPGSYYEGRYSRFVENITKAMHDAVPSSRVTVSVYAAAAKEFQMYNIKELAQASDGIFMMAYDFATLGADKAMPTAPLYGYKDGKYWYDVSTAVEDFLKVMPAEKLILGVPYYGYNYLVESPEVKSATLPYWTWKGNPTAQTYTLVQNHIHPGEKYHVVNGWDDTSKVGWKAYYDYNTYTWRMVFFEDERSLSYKYQFAKEKKLAGVGIWALGFDEGKDELWTLLRDEFGRKYADVDAHQREIKDLTYFPN